MKLAKSAVAFNPDSHTYTLDGRTLRGITGMISRQLFPGKYAGVPESVLSRAAEKGSLVHASCELADTLGIAPDCEEAQGYMRLKERFGLRPAGNEYLVSDGKDFASCIDIVLEEDGECAFSLADIKTTANLDTEYVSWQLSVYAVLFEGQNPGAEIRKLYAVWLRGGNAELVEVERKPAPLVRELMRCELAGEQFRPPAEAVPASGRLPERYAEAEQAVVSLVSRLKELEAQKEALLYGLGKEMERAGVRKWESDRIRLTLKEDSVRETFDTKAFREENPGLYSRYLRRSAVKGNVSLKIKQL